MFLRLWVRIPAPYTGWIFFTFICCKNCVNICLKRLKINEKEAGPIFRKKSILGNAYVSVFTFYLDVPSSNPEEVN